MTRKRGYAWKIRDNFLRKDPFTLKASGDSLNMSLIFNEKDLFLQRKDSLP